MTTYKIDVSLETLAMAALYGAIATAPYAAKAQNGAQEPETAEAQTSASEQETPVGSGDEILVTGTKRASASTIYETPSAVSAFGPTQLAEAKVESLSDLITMIPNVVLNGTAVVPGLNREFVSICDDPLGRISAGPARN